jgi:hypothetical protein
MSENNLDWLSRVSQEDSEKASIKLEGMNPKAETEAVNVIGGDEKLTNEGKSAGNHEVNLKDDTVPDDNAVAAKAEGEIGVKVSNEAAPDIQIKLTPGAKVANEDGDEEEEEEDAAAAPGADGQPPAEPAEPAGELGAEPSVPAGIEPAATEPNGEVTPPAELTEPVEPVVPEEPGAPEIPAEPTEPVVPAGEEPTEPALPVVGLDELPPAEGEPAAEPLPGEEAPVVDGLPADAAPELDSGVPAVVEGTDAPALGETAPAAATGEPGTGGTPGVTNTEIGPEATEPATAGDAGIKEGAEPEVPVAIDPVIEIKEGTDAAVADAIADGEPPIEPEMTEEKPAEEDFDGQADDGIFDEFNETDGDASELGAMGAALEGYTEILRDVSRTGGAVDPLLARSIQIGLQAFKGEDLDKGMPSMEDFEDPVGRLTVSNELSEDLKGKAAAAGQAIMNVIKKLLEQLGNAVAELKHNLPALEQKNQDLLNRVGAVRSSTADGQVPVGSAQRLFIGDNFGGDAPMNYANLRKFGDMFMVDYPKFYEALAMKFKQKFEASYDETVSYDLADIAEVIGEGFRPGMFGVVKVEAGVVPNGDRYASTFASPTLMGNRRIVVGMTPSPEKNGVKSLTDVWSVNLVIIESHMEGTTEVKLPDPNQLKGIIEELRKLTAQVPRYIENTRKLAQNQNIAKCFTHRWLVGAAGEHGASALTQSMTKPTGHFVGHVVNTIKVAQAFVEHCVKLHEAGKQ